MPVRHFGAIPGIEIGTVFENRPALAVAGVHKPTQAGISGSGGGGADSIVLSGGYEDDEDQGDFIIYTGQGGNDPETKKQIADQQLTRGNLALARSMTEGLPVRVVRGATHYSPYSPATGYRYDGLFSVEDYWHETGRSGFLIWRFRLRQLDESITPEEGVAPEEGSGVEAAETRRRPILTSRIIRNTAMSMRVKELHDYQCQVCGLALDTGAGKYAEAAHIRPLGKPHNGPDASDNILCLCPNHHVLFDFGGFSIQADLNLIGIDGRLRTVKGHKISQEHLKYHREHYGM